jgi:hypothetical protein
MKKMNLDTLARAGQPPWHPVPRAEDLDVWDKYEFPICGTYRLDGHLIIFTLVTTGATRSLWAYVPVAPEQEQSVAEAHFDTEAEFDGFLDGCFAGHNAVFAAAENFVITSKSDGVAIPRVRGGLLMAGAKWYAMRAAADMKVRADNAKVQLDTAQRADDPEELLRAAQGVLTNLPA